MPVVIRLSAPDAPGTIGFLCDTLNSLGTVEPGETTDIEITPNYARANMFMNHVTVTSSKARDMKGSIIVVEAEE